jgi:hypothetical protein
MTTAAKPTATTSLPDPSGSYITMVFPEHTTRENNFLTYQGYFANIQITPSGSAYNIICGTQTLNNVSYTAYGDNPNVGLLEFSLTLNGSLCTFVIQVFNPPGRGLFLQGTVSMPVNDVETPFESRWLTTSIPAPAGTYTVTAVNTALNGTLVIVKGPSTNQLTGTYQLQGQTNITTIDPAPLWNAPGTPYLLHSMCWSITSRPCTLPRGTDTQAKSR